MPPQILLGRSSFPSLREAGALYVDKSGFVKEILDAPADVILYPRPRRFGKTLNLSMARAFFEEGPDRSALFEGLSVWAEEPARAHFQRYPVIALTFKDVKQRTWAEAKTSILATLGAEIERHAAALDDPRVKPGLRASLRKADLGDASRILLDLCEALFVHHGQSVVLLIDEYDAPVLNAWEQGHYEEAVSFFRGLLSGGLKDNPWLFKGVLTGILRVAKESMFSGLNNVAVYSLLAADRPEPFGFTELEVLALLRDFGRGTEVHAVRHWYNGYRFGNTTVYNPWSIVNFLAHPLRSPEPYWLNTSENALVRSLLLGNADLHAEIKVLLEGGSIEVGIEENVPLRELYGEHIWSLLLFSGYLTADASKVEGGRRRVALRIPNAEVRLVWEDTFLGWLSRTAGKVEPLHRALLEGDAERTQAILQGMLLRHPSTHDVASDQDEIFYHAFVLGLLVTLEKSHFVRSNRESGVGRPDVLLVPRTAGQAGVVLEFKRKEKGRKLLTTARAALRQIQDGKYDTELETAGARPIHRLGVAFAGKEVAVVGEKG